MMIGESKKSVVSKLIFVTAVIICALFFPRECSEGAKKGIYFCAEVLVPSLFPFMAAASFIVKSGLSAAAAKYIGRASGAVFGVSGSSGAIIILGLFGGYPVGARGLRTLYESGEISLAEAKKCACFAVGAGPGFLVTFVGINLLGSAEIGGCLLLSQIISVIILGFLNKHIFGVCESRSSDKVIRHKKPGDAVVDSVVSGTYGCVEMCGMVVIFSAFVEVISHLIVSEAAAGAFNLLFEVTTACSRLAAGNHILLIAFAVGFGGLSVHFQIFQALGSIDVSRGLFFLYRIIQGLMTAGLTYAFIRLFRITLPVFAKTAELSLSTSLPGSVLLILTGLCFIYNLGKS